MSDEKAKHLEALRQMGEGAEAGIAKLSAEQEQTEIQKAAIRDQKLCRIERKIRERIQRADRTFEIVGKEFSSRLDNGEFHPSVPGAWNEIVRIVSAKKTKEEKRLKKILDARAQLHAEYGNYLKPVQ